MGEIDDARSDDLEDLGESIHSGVGAEGLDKGENNTQRIQIPAIAVQDDASLSSSNAEVGEVIGDPLKTAQAQRSTELDKRAIERPQRGVLELDADGLPYVQSGYKPTPPP